MAPAAPYTRARLPADLHLEILSRLPVKSLLRFRCVSKPWLALVDDDTKFARLHLNTFKNNREETRLFVDGKQKYEVRCIDTFEPIPGTLPPVEPGYWYWKKIYSIDGLILLKSRAISEVRDLMVWNPSVRKFLLIPPLPFYDFYTVHEDIGLGYDPVAKDYKLVKLIFTKGTLQSVAIYSLGLGKWRIEKFQGNFDPMCSNWHLGTPRLKEAVYFRSSLYFIAKDRRGWNLVQFDLSKEEFSCVKMPYGRKHYYNWWKFMLVDGGSALKAFDLSNSDIYVWSLDSESMCWTKTHVYYLKECDLLYIKKNGDMLTWRTSIEYLADKTGKAKLVERDDLALYHCETEGYKTLGRHFRRSVYPESPRVCCYVESLILHK